MASFIAADLDRSQWQNATFDGAVFARCDFHRTDFSPTTAAPAATTRGARFEDCDLRGTRWDDRDLSGAVFLRCRMDGVYGVPRALAAVVTDDPDPSSGGDGSVIGIAADVLAMWRPRN